MGKLVNQGDMAHQAGFEPMDRKVPHFTGPEARDLLECHTLVGVVDGSLATLHGEPTKEQADLPHLY